MVDVCITLGRRLAAARRGESPRRTARGPRCSATRHFARRWLLGCALIATFGISGVAGFAQAGSSIGVGDVESIPLPGAMTLPAPRYLTYQPISRWSGSFQWFYNPVGAPAWADPATVVAVVQGAFAKWSATCNVTAVYAGTSSATPGSLDGRNVVGWSGSIGNTAQTRYWYTGAGGAYAIVEADIMFQLDRVSDLTVLDGMATHEAGHVLGLTHSDAQDAVMAGTPATAYNTAAYQQTLRADDIAGCQFLYGATSAAVAGVPTCTLSTASNAPAAGSTITLVATCTNDPTTYAWTNCSSTTSTCQTSSATTGSKSYGVAASNAAGSGPTANLTVNWISPLPACTLSSSAGGSPQVGALVTLTANCTNNPTSYVWQGCASSGPTCTATASAPGIAAYSVTPVNAAGQGLVSRLSLDWLPAQVPTCTLDSSVGGNPVPLGSSVTLIANCQNAPTSYVWTGCAPVPGTATCAATAAAAGTATYQVSASNSAGTSTPVSTSVNWYDPATAVPVCAITSSHGATPIVGAAVTLTAACQPGADSYEWTGCTVGGNPSTCLATAATAGRQQYRVVGRNRAGTGAPAIKELDWQSAEGAPTCTLVASSLAPAVGSPLSLTAQCTNNPTTFAWTHCVSSGPNCTTTAAEATTVTYEVVASNASGASAPARLTVPWIQTVPICTLIATPASASIGTPVTLTATCTGSPSIHVWTGCRSTGATCTAQASTAGPQTYSVTASNTYGAGAAATTTVIWLPAGAHATQTVVEFHHEDLDHYFITANATEIAKLDNGVFKGWARTGLTFTVLAPDVPMTGDVTPVCRFYGDPAAGLDSHFYSASPTECGQVKEKFKDWIWESDAVFAVYRPDSTSGACPASTVPLYRAWNTRRDSNHRYTTRVDVQAAMVAKGYIAEGYGNPPVVMCVPR